MGPAALEAGALYPGVPAVDVLWALIGATADEAAGMTDGAAELGAP